MNKLRIFCIVMVLCCIMGVAKGKSSQALPDNVVTENNAVHYMFSDTKKAEAIIEEATRMMEVTDYKNKYDNLHYHYNMLLVYYEKNYQHFEINL